MVLAERAYTLRSAVTSEGPPSIIVVEVGPDRKRYHVHKTFLTHYSEYFRKALRGKWKEAKEGLVKLDDVEVGACKSTACQI
jgi:hypothetical protein